MAADGWYFDMSSTINATTVGVGGVVTTADNSGILVLQTASTDAVTISAAQGVTLAGTLGVTGITTVAAGSAAAPSIVSTTGTADTGQFFPAADTIAYSTAGTERMRIDSTGLVGIGTTSPSSFNSNAYNLVVGSGSGEKGITIYTGTAVGGNIHFADGTSGADSYRGIIRYQHNDNSMLFYTDATERLRISSAGVVSVTGSATISSTLAVTGITTVAAGSAALPSIVSTTGTADTGQWFPAADTIAYSTSGAERVRITSSGLVGINTTTPANNLHVRRGGTGFVAKIENYTNSASAHGLIIDFGDGTPSAGAIAIQFFRVSNPTAIGSITQSGDNVVYNTSSDRRLKENITPTSYGLSDLMKIPVTDFNFITSPAFRTPGFIAQDLYKVYPFAVTTNGDEGVDPISADATMGWQVDYSRITPLLVSAIQELKAIIDTQAARITALETL